MVNMRDIYAALIQEKGHRGRAAERVGLRLRTFHRRLAEANCAAKLATMADEYGWPSPTEAATEAARERAAERRGERLVGA